MTSKRGINFVVTCPTTEVRDTLIRAIEETGGPGPVAKNDTVSACRAKYGDAVSRTIINTSSQKMRETLGHHRVCTAIEVDDPVAAAEKAKQIFEEAGFEARVHTHAQPEYPDGFIVFLVVPDLDGILLLFWPRNPDPAILPTLPKDEPWVK